MGWSSTKVPIRSNIFLHWRSDSIGAVACCDGQVQIKSCTLPRHASRPQASAMRLYDRSADTKPHTGALEFRCVEGVENLLRKMRRKACSGVTHGYENF